MLSTSFLICLGGEGVNFITTKETIKFSIIPINPIPSGEIPNSQFSGVFDSGLINLKFTIYAEVKAMPVIIPEMAPCLFIRLLKMPMMMTGKTEEAASPNAKATVAVT